MIYVATIGIVMSNMFSNSVKVYTSIDKLCYRQKCTLTFYDYVCKIGLTLHGQVVCSVFSASLGCHIG